MISLFGSHIYFVVLFLQMSIKFYCNSFTFHIEIVYTCVCIQILMPIKCSVDSLKYFTFVSHIHSFTPMIPSVFHLWQSYLLFTNADEVFTAIYKYFTLKLYIHVY